MRTYTERRLFNKYWGWYEAPHDVEHAAIANFFSYDRCEAEGFRRTESLTSIIDLSRPIQAIWNDMRANFIRKQIEQGERRGVTVQRGWVPAFYDLYHDFCRRMGIGRAAYDSLEGHGILFTSWYEGALIGGGGGF